MANPNLPINTKFNTYIGARYVPKFANKDLNYQWTNTRTYEPLMIVLYQGNSYTSTTFVPVGIDITNIKYWAPTGSYNAQVEQYRQEVLQYLGNRPFRSAKDFGIGLGNNDSELLQNAVEQCATNGWVLWIEPYTTAILDVTVNLPANTFIRLDGTLKFSSSNEGRIFNNYDGKPHPGYTGNSNIVIYGNGKMVYDINDPTNFTSICSFSHADGIFIYDISIDIGFSTHAFEIISCKNVHILNVTMDGNNLANNYHTSAIQIEVSGSTSGQGGAIPYDRTPCREIFIKNCTIKNIQDGIESQAQSQTNVDYHYNIVISDNQFLNIQQNCITPYGYCQSVIENNYAYNIGRGLVGEFSIGANFGTQNIDLDIINNTIVKSGQNYIGGNTAQNNCPILLNYGKNINVKDNIINHCNSWGLALISCDQCVVQNNLFDGICEYNMTSQSATVSMFNFSNSTGILFLDNVCKVNSEDSWSAQVFVASTSPDVVSGCYLQMPKLYKSGAGKFIQANVTQLATGNFKLNDVVNISDLIWNYDYLILYISLNGQQSTIIPTDGRTGFSISNVSTDYAKTLYGHLTLGNNSITIDKISTINLLTDEITNEDSSVIITAIYGISGSNIRNIPQIFSA